MLETSNEALPVSLTLLATPIRIALIIGTGLAANHLIQRLIPRFRELLAKQQETLEGMQRVRTLSRVLRYALTVAVLVITALLVLGEFGISIAPLLGAAGVAGVAIGFGAQSLVKDYFTGFFLLLENQIRIGDIIDAGGKSGVVEELTLRYLRLRDYHGNVHYVPNGQITVVTNMSLGYAFAVVDLGVAYGEDVDKVVAVMEEVGALMQADPLFGPDIQAPLEIAGVDRWADSSVVIRCRFQVNPGKQWGVRREYLRLAKAAFDAQGIEIPFPHVKLVPPLPAAPPRAI